MDHATAHRDGVLEDFFSNAELLEGVNAAGGEGKINRASADEVAFARVGPAFVKIDLVTAPAEECGEESTGKTTANQNKIGHN
jgi:hypothetical protein